MEWKQNKWVGIAVGIIAIGCLVIALRPFVQRVRENRKAAKEAQQWIEKEKGHLLLGPEGWSRGWKR